MGSPAYTALRTRDMSNLPTIIFQPVKLLSLLYSVQLAYGSPTGQYFISTPDHTAVTAGQHAKLSCTVGNMIGSCHWTRDGFPLGTGRSLAGFSRYLMAGDGEHVCDLTIDPVLPLDEG